MTSRFSTRRGRPKTVPKPQIDHGTPELAFKRAHGDTTEAIDLCLQRRIITPAHHRSALHLRWLYTIRFGAPSISALDISRSTGAAIITEDDPTWRQAREQNYNEAVTLLKKHDAYDVVMQCCIYNERPIFLRHSATTQSFNNAELRLTIQHTIDTFLSGLSALTHAWKR